MADLYRAYKLLNSTYSLGLSEAQIMAAEKMAKMAIGKENGLGVDADKVDSWEFFLHLTPRKDDAEDRGPLDVEQYKHFLPQ